MGVCGAMLSSLFLHICNQQPGQSMERELELRRFGSFGIDPMGAGPGAAVNHDELVPAGIARKRQVVIVRQGAPVPLFVLPPARSQAPRWRRVAGAS